MTNLKPKNREKISFASKAMPVRTHAQIASGKRAGRRLMDLGVQALGIGMFYVVVLIYFSVRVPHFFEYPTLTTILADVAVLGIVSIGQALVIISGGFDLSVSGVLALGGVSYSLFVNNGFDIASAIILVVLVGAAIGLLNGLTVAKIGINPLITTLGTLSIATGLAFTVTGGLNMPFDVDLALAAGVWGNIAFARIQYGVIAFVILAILGFFILRHTTFGRTIYALGGNREASRLAGIRVDLTTVTVYVISSSLAAFAGVITASQLLTGVPSVGADANLRSITAVILGGAALTGGVGGIPGTVLGVLLLGTIANGMALMQVPTFYQQIATGFVLLLAVGFGRLRAIVRREE